MSNGYEVIANDLEDAGNRCHNASEDYKGSMPNAGFSGPDCGEEKLTKMLGVFLKATGQMHLILAQALAQHGRKLDDAANTYSEADNKTEASLRILLGQIRMSPDAPGDNGSSPS
ncbi:DUF6317 family protein [Spirillospora sp. NPDC052269]